MTRGPSIERRKRHGVEKKRRRDEITSKQRAKRENSGPRARATKRPETRKTAG